MDRLGLATVLESSLGVSVTKDKKLQRSDWTHRPLKPKALNYAADDVRYLLELADTLKEKLRELRRLDWVLEESARIAAIRYIQPDPAAAVFRVKGSRHLNGQALAVLKSLVDYREIHTLKAGRPHFRVIPDAALVELAEKPDSSLKKVRGLGRFSHGRLASGIREAIRKGQAADPLRRPVNRQPRPRLSKAQRAEVSTRLDRLKKWRTATGKSFTLDPALIWPMTSMKALANDPQELERELKSPDVRKWQRAEFGPSVRRALDPQP